MWKWLGSVYEIEIVILKYKQTEEDIILFGFHYNRDNYDIDYASQLYIPHCPYSLCTFFLKCMSYATF